MLGEALQGEEAEEADVFIRLWHQAMAEVDFLARKLASAACRDEEELMQEKSKQSRVNMQEKLVSIEVGEVVKILGKATQMKLMASKLLKEEVGEVIIKANPEAGEEFNKCDNSFPHEPGADSEQSKSKIKEMMSPWLSGKSNLNAEVGETLTSSKKDQTKSSQPEKKVLYTAEQCQILAEVESWEEEGAEPGLHVELLSASKELMAEVEAWGHEDDAEADISEPSCAQKQEAEEVEIITKALAEEDCLSRKLASIACCDEEELVQEKKEQYKEVPLMIDKQDLVEVSLSMQIEGVPGMKAEVETMVDKMQHAQEQNVQVKQRLMMEVEIKTEVEKNWQDSFPLVDNKQNLVEVAVSKKLKTRLMHALKAEAIGNLRQNLMEEKLLEFCKQHLKVEEREEEGHEARELLIDKQAAAAG